MEERRAADGFRLQTDPRLNEGEAWPAERFPEARYHWFRDCGCLVCALSALLRHHGLETSETFSPWELNRRLIDAGGFTPAADLRIGSISRLYPLEYREPVPYSREELVRIAGQGFPCLVTVPGVRGERHFLALLRLLPEDALVFDPLTGLRRLGEYPRVCEIRWFRPGRPDGAAESADPNDRRGNR